MADHNQLGKKGEMAAVEFLRQNGHHIIERNFRFGKSEIDIISRENSTIVFTEVKTRSTDYFGYPEEAVDKRKIRKIQQAAAEYIYRQKIEGPVRFDIVSATQEKEGMKIYHIKDAFFNEDAGLTGDWDMSQTTL